MDVFTAVCFLLLVPAAITSRPKLLYDHQQNRHLHDEEAVGSAYNEVGEEEDTLPGFNTFDHCIMPPLECPNENITFWFYTRSTQDNPLQITQDNLREMKYGKRHPWKLILHGYTGWKDYAPNTEIRPAYFRHGDYNIISIDYKPLVMEPCYYQATRNVPLVANCTAQLVDALVEAGIFQLPQLHVIGFSLGGQVAGHVQGYLRSGRIHRLTGLDPALPLFISPLTSKLDPTDADFVDVIHTNAARKGQISRCGHVDFYPNGGYSQLGCTEAEYGSISSCNHARAAVYFAESITSRAGFWGIPCNSYITFYWGWCSEETNMVIMGEYTPRTANGSYYLETRNSPPYARGRAPAPSPPQGNNATQSAEN